MRLPPETHRNFRHAGTSSADADRHAPFEVGTNSGTNSSRSTRVRPGPTPHNSADSVRPHPPPAPCGPGGRGFKSRRSPLA
jgi:hypothetical protein